MIFIIQGFKTIVFIFIAMFTTFWKNNNRSMSSGKKIIHDRSNPYRCKKMYFISPKNSLQNGYAVGSLSFQMKMIWRLQVQSWQQASNNTGILKTCHGYC